MKITFKSTIVSILLLATIFVAWLTYLDIYAVELNSKSLLETTISFASLKFLETILSLASNTPFLGVALEPLKEFLSWISSLFFLSLLSLSLQKVILIFAQSYILNTILTIFVLLYIANSFFAFLNLENGRKIALSVAILIFFRFSLVIITFLTIFVESEIKAYQELSSNKIEILSSKIENYEELIISNSEESQKSSWFSSFKDKSKLALENIKEYSKELLEAYTLLVVLFLFRNLILPLIFLWIFYRLLISFFTKKE